MISIKFKDIKVIYERNKIALLFRILDLAKEGKTIYVNKELIDKKDRLIKNCKKAIGMRVNNANEIIITHYRSIRDILKNYDYRAVKLVKASNSYYAVTEVHNTNNSVNYKTNGRLNELDIVIIENVKGD